MFYTLDLDYSQLETMQFKDGNFQNLQEVFDALDQEMPLLPQDEAIESEIIEKPESDKKSDQSAVDTSDPKSKKKEEKKLTIEYF